MKKRTLMVSALATALYLSAGLALADDQERARERVQTQEQIYGSQLMTEEERTAQRDKMRAAKTAEEREQIRDEHHERMDERARERGVALPDEPSARGSGMGSGTRSGSGAGSGGGMGRGGGKGGGGGRGR